MAKRCWKTIGDRLCFDELKWKGSMYDLDAVHQSNNDRRLALCVKTGARNDELVKEHRKIVTKRGWKKICEFYYYSKLWQNNLTADAEKRQAI